MFLSNLSGQKKVIVDSWCRQVCDELYSVLKKFQRTRVEFNWFITFLFLWIIDTSVKPLKFNLKSPFKVYIWAFHDQRSQSGQRVGEDDEEERLWSDSANQKTEAGALANKSTGLRDSVTGNVPVLNQTHSRTLNSSSEARSGMNLCLLIVIKWLFVVMLP